MAEQRARRRWRIGVTWGLSALLVAAFLLVGGEEGPANPAEDTGRSADDDQRIEIVEVKPADPYPGSAVVIRVLAAVSTDKVTATLGGHASGAEDKKSVTVLSWQPGQIVVRIPNSAQIGGGKLRVSDGSRASKPYDIRIKAPNRRKLLGSIVGGLALLVFGLRLMAQGSRGFTGQRSRLLLTRIGQRRSWAVGLGVIVGGLTQFTTSAAGMVVSLIDAHLLTVGPAVAVMLGAQFGAAAAPLVLVQAGGREGLLVVAIGVVVVSLAVDRRSEAWGKIVLGMGLLFYGLYILRDGFQPLVASEEILAYIDYFRADSPRGVLVCAATGAVLAALLQGPAPVFVLVLGIAQSTGKPDLASSLAILAGTGAGSATAAAMMAWPFGPEARRMALVTLALALVGSVLAAASVDLWAGLAESLVPRSAAEIAYGKKVLLPNGGQHIAAGVLMSQGALTVLLAALLPVALQVAEKMSLGSDARRAGPGSNVGPEAIRSRLPAILGRQREALACVHALALAGHRAQGRKGEHILADARVDLEKLFSDIVYRGTADTAMPPLRRATLAALQLQRALEDLLRHAERRTERAVMALPTGSVWQLGPDETHTLKSIHALLLEGLDTAAAQIQSGAVTDIDAPRGREILLNAIEAETRQGLVADARGTDSTSTVALKLASTDLVNAYESVGNHLYRLYEALADEVDQEAVSASV